CQRQNRTRHTDPQERAQSAHRSLALHEISPIVPAARRAALSELPFMRVLPAERALSPGGEIRPGMAAGARLEAVAAVARFRQREVAAARRRTTVDAKAAVRSEVAAVASVERRRRLM